MSLFDPYRVYTRPGGRTRSGQIVRKRPIPNQSAFSAEEIPRAKTLLEAFGYSVSPYPISPQTPLYFDIRRLGYNLAVTGYQANISLSDILNEIPNLREWIIRSQQYPHARLQIIIYNTIAYLINASTGGTNQVSYSLLGTNYNNLQLVTSTTAYAPMIVQTLSCVSNGYLRYVQQATQPSTSTVIELAYESARDGSIARYEATDGDVYGLLSGTAEEIPGINVSISDQNEGINSVGIAIEFVFSCYN